jgi:hypothetical protein
MFRAYLGPSSAGRLLLKCDGTRAVNRFRLWAKRTSPFKSAERSVQSTTGSQGVSISGSNAGYTMFWGSVKSTGYPLHSPVSPSLPLPCVTVCHHVSTGFYNRMYTTIGYYYSFQMNVCCPGWCPTRTTDIHLKRIIRTKCCIHKVVPSDDGPRYTRNM